MARKRGAFFALMLAAAGAAFPATAQPLAPDDAARLEAMRKAADDLDEAADPAAYRKAWEEVLAFASTLYPADHPELAVLQSEFVTADYLEGDIQGALRRTEELIARLDGAGPEYATRVTDLMNGQMVILMTLGRYDRARPLGAEILARRRAQYGGRADKEVAAALSNYAGAEFNFGNYDAAIDLVRQAIAEAERLDPVPPNAAIWYSNLPIYLNGAGRLEEAIEAARATAVRLDALLPATHPFPATNLNTLAAVLLQVGKVTEAETTARRAVERAEATLGRKQQTAVFMTTLAETLTAQGKADEARTIAEAALAILEADLGPEADRTLSAREALAGAMAAAGDLQEALALQRAVMATREAKFPAYHPERIDAADRLAALALEAGALEEARTVQAEAQRLRSVSFPTPDLATLAGAARLGAIEVRSGNRDAGLAAVRAAVEAVGQRARQLAAADLHRSRDTQHIKTAYGWALDAATAAGDEPFAFRLAQRLMTGATDRTVAEAAARANADPQVAALLRERQDAAAALERVLDRQLRAAARGADRDTLEAFDAERGALTAALARATAALARSAPQVARGELPEPLALGDAQRALGSDEAVLVAASGPMRMTLFAITREGAEMADVAAGSDRLGALVGRLRAGIVAEAPFDFAASADLHDLLFPAAVRTAIAGKRRLFVSAGGALEALPFALLARKSTGPTLRTAHWLIRDHAVATLPSLLALTAPRRNRGGKDVRSFVAIGAPALTAAGTGGPAYRSAGNVATIASLPPLPATGQELAALGRTLGAEATLILTGAEATEAALRQADLASADVVAFATHGLVAGELAGLDEAALVLTPAGEDDGLLTASEIMRLRMDADWVVLSACNTAAGADLDSEGLSGLGRAFLHAGARNLLASHWAVRDDAAAYLSVETVRGYRGGLHPAEALRQAMLTMIDGSPLPGAEQPANWAPFVLVGR